MPAPIDLTAAPQTDPTAILRYRDCLYADDMLIAAFVHLDLFSWVHARGRTGATADEIGSAFSLAARPCDVMITLFKARRLLVEDAEGALRLSGEAEEFLVASSPWCLAPYYASLRDRRGALDLLEVLRSGRPILWGGGNAKRADWHVAMDDAGFAARFTEAMDCRGVILARALARQVDLARQYRLLDIAGGSGIYACSLLAHHPHLEAAVLEKPPVDQIAAHMIERRGFAGRVDVCAGDMMVDPLPAGFDVHLWSNVLHDWEIPEVKRLVAASAAALPSGGLIIIHEAFLNARKDGPLHVAEYSVTLAHATWGRCYGTGEMSEWLAEAGFVDVTYADTAAARGVMTGRRT